MMIPQNTDIEKNLAIRLKSIRTERSLSLDELAKRSGVSRATLSRIEKCEVSPTTHVLSKLCTALELTLSRLMILAESTTLAVISREHQTVWMDTDNGFKRRSVSPPDEHLSCEILECELSANTYIKYDAPPIYGLEHHLVLLEGELEVTIEDKPYILSPGDCIRYKLQGSSAYRVLNNKTVRYILVLL